MIRHNAGPGLDDDPGTRWFDAAGPWADDAISAYSYGDLVSFVMREDRREDVSVDPRRIIGTDHASYNQGMTWRRFLRDAKRIDSILSALRDKPGYYADPIAMEPGGFNPHWTLDEIDGDYFVVEGNHRSVVAKFRAMEDGINPQRIPLVRTLTLDRAAMRAVETLKDLVRAHQGFQPDREKLPPSTKGQQRFRCGFYLYGVGVPVYELQTPEDAIAIVKKANRWRYRLEGLRGRWWGT